MGLSPDSLAKLTVAITISYRIQYMGLAFFSIYYYHYFETLVEEISSIWSQKWRTGKILYLVARYLPIVLIVLELLCGYSVNLILSPKVCGRLWTTVQVARWATTAASEGAKRRYIALLIVAYAGLTTGVHVSLFKYHLEASQAERLSQLDREQGYACTWKSHLSEGAMKGRREGEYITLAKSICTAILVVAVFTVRYRNQACSLLKIIRRDSGVYIFSLTAINLGNTISSAYRLSHGVQYVPAAIMADLQRFAVPILACRLLINIRKTEDTQVRSAVSTILFEPYQAGGESQSGSEEDDASSEHQRETAQYSGLGRRRGREGINVISADQA